MAKHDFPEFDDLEPEGGTVQRNGHQPTDAYSLDPEASDFLDDEFVDEGIEEEELEIDYLEEFDDEDELYDELLDEFAGFDEFDEFDADSWAALEDEEEFPARRRRPRQNAPKRSATQRPARRRRNQHEQPQPGQRRPQRRPQRRSQQRPPQSAPQMLPPTTADAPQQSPTQGRAAANAAPEHPPVLALWLAKRAAQSSNGAKATRLLLTATGVTVQAAPLARDHWQVLPVLLQRVPPIVAMLRRQRQTRLLLAQWPHWITQTLAQLSRFAARGQQVTPSLAAAVLQRIVQRTYQQQLRAAPRSPERRRGHGSTGAMDLDAAEWWEDESDL